MRAVVASQPTRICGWAGECTSKWKCAYIGAAHCALRRTITRAELTSNVWRLSFKSHDSGAEVLFTPFYMEFNNVAQQWQAEFRPNGTYHSTPPFNHPEGLSWKFVGGSGGNFDAIQVGQVGFFLHPPLFSFKLIAFPGIV